VEQIRSFLGAVGMGDESQTSEARTATIERLRHAGSEPELLLELFMDAGRIPRSCLDILGCRPELDRCRC
jgi:hypothetical protein